MKVLVTGASGFLGRYALASLRQRGIDAVAVGWRNPSIEGLAFIQMDMLAGEDFSHLIAATGATHLLHLAWYVEHGEYWTSPLNLRWVDASVKLVEAFCQAGGKQVVAAGTCAEYDWTQGHCIEDLTPLNPATLYGVAKDATRRLITAVCEQHQVQCAWGRIFLPYGVGEARQRLIPSLIDALQGKRAAFSVNALARRDFLHATDVAEGFTTLLQSGVGGAYNISSGKPLQIAELVNKIAQLLGCDAEAILGLAAERPGEPMSLVGESKKLKALGWRPQYTLESGLQQIIEGLT